ncbi:hypothetical protein LMG8520_0026 [Lactococcus lactis subsp. lactis]|nr:hypothetical protein [Lactococcus lactis]KAA8702574.1 iron chaperone [Lactococcus lactis subsp. hordniae]KSU14977.1 hypothetical protein LMG8520_0026 [Lactococcus lactis subsp. lactis]MCT3135092.1 iron chaperone [Lactococcus lactis]
MEFEDYFKNDELMNIVRETVKLVFPEAQELPALFKDKNVLIYASSQKKHLGIYPKPNFIENNSASLKEQYECSKGTIKVPYDVETNELKRLVSEIVKWNLGH